MEDSQHTKAQTLLNLPNVLLKDRPNSKQKDLN